MATTDDPSDDLAAHSALAADPTWSGRVIPTFRPDRYLEPAQPGWRDAVAQLGKAADVDTGDYAGYVRALEARRRYFVEHGAVSADHSHVDVRTDPLEPGEAARIYRSALAADTTPEGGRGIPPAHAAGDGPDVLRRRARDDPAPRGAPRPPRPHDRTVRRRHGQRHPRPGWSSPTRCARCWSATARIRGIHLVVFTMDETVFSRELAPLAGFYPSVYLGRAVVVPRRPARHPPLPGGGHRDRRVLPDVRVHRRHPRVLLDPGAPRHVPPRRRRLARPARGRAPARRGRGPGDRGRAGRRPADERCSSCDRPQPAGRPCRAPPGTGGAAAPVRLVHLGLGNFFRAHQAWYTDQAPDAADWGIAAFTGRSGDLADSLSAQDGLYTLITRAADGDRFEVVSSLTRTHPGPDHDAWLGHLASPDVSAVTITVTEAGLPARRDGGLDRDRPRSARDVEALRGDLAAPCTPRPPGWSPAAPPAGAPTPARSPSSPATTCPATARRWAASSTTWREMVDPALAEWMAGSVSFVTTMVDRITPRTTPDDRRAVADGTGRDDCCPVATEPFHEWVLSGAFPAGRPDWDGRRRHDHRRHRALRAPQALAAQRRPLAAGLRRLGPRAPDRRRGRGRRRLPELDAAVVGRGVTPSRPAGGRCPGLPRRAARPVRQPAHAPPARPDRRRRVPEAAGPHPAGPARGAGCRSPARGRGPGAGGLGVPPAWRRARPWTTSAPSR